MDKSLVRPVWSRSRTLFVLAACFLLIAVGVSNAFVAKTAHASGPVTLPGEALWNGVPSLDFGSNDGVNWDPNYNMDVAPDGPTIQADLLAGGIPVIRAWFFQNSLVDNHAVTDAEQLQKLQAVQNSGAICFANFPTNNTVAYDLHLLSILNGACPYVEVMNEPDIEGVNSTQYLAFWNSFVPQARSQFPGILFGGPADYDNQGNECTYDQNGSTCFLQKVMIGMQASGNLPDFVTYHWYPCWNMDAATCLAQAGTYASAAQTVIDEDTQIFGHEIPVICSEWNADPGNPSYMTDRNWDAQYITAALQNIETSGLAGSMYYDISEYGNYGADDEFDIYNGGAPFATWTAHAAEIARVKNNTPPPAPSISSFTPTSGQSGDAVTIVGSAFTGATEVTFDGVTATYTVDSDTQISATVPVGAATSPIGVVTPNGSTSSSTNFTVNGSPPPAPTISGFSPSSGQVGDSVVITGSAFTGATTVDFNGASASFTVDSDTQITATVPTGATSGDLSVTTPNGTGTSSSSFTVNTGGGGGGSTNVLVQSASNFVANAASNPTNVSLTGVGANHLLVAVISLAGGNAYTVSSVSDSLGNTWSLVKSGQNGDATDVEIWYTNSASAGDDTITAVPGGASGFLQSVMTVGEWDMPATPNDAASTGSNGTAHNSGSFISQPGDFVVGGYADAGYNAALSPSDGKSVLGTDFDSTVNMQSDQSYGIASGTTASAAFSSSASTYGQVTAAGFTPNPPPLGSCTQAATYNSLSVTPSTANPGDTVTFDLNVSTACAEGGFAEFDLLNSSGTQLHTWDFSVTYDGTSQDIVETVTVPTEPAGNYTISSVGLDGNGAPLDSTAAITAPLTIGDPPAGAPAPAPTPTPSPTPSPTPTTQNFNSAPCTVTIAGVSHTGTCSGSITYQP